MSQFNLESVTPEHRRILINALGNSDAANAIADKLDGLGDKLTPGTNIEALMRAGFRLHVDKLTFEDLAVTITDTGGANGGYGTHKIADLPQGLAILLGARSSFTIAAAAGIGATATVKHSLGSAAEATNDTLDSTQANIIASTNSVLADSAGTASGVSTAVVVLNGTSTPADIILNFGVADAGITATSSITIDGYVEVAWLVLP